MRKLLAGSLFLALLACGQPKPVKITGLDLEVLKRTEAQLQALSMRYQSEAGPIVQEHDNLIAKYCSLAGLVAGPNGNCIINPNTGDVMPKPSQPGIPPAPPKK